MFKDFKFLIVDDIPATRRILKRYLYKLEVEFSSVTEAHSGHRAISLLQTGKFDVVICDLNLQDVSGLEVLSYVRSTERTKNLPFIIMTSEQDRMGVTMAVSGGVSSYILKPITLGNVEEHVGNALKRHGIEFGVGASN